MIILYMMLLKARHETSRVVTVWEWWKAKEQTQTVHDQGSPYPTGVPQAKRTGFMSESVVCVLTGDFESGFLAATGSLSTIQRR